MAELPTRDAREAIERDTGPVDLYIYPRLVASATIRERRLLLAQVRLLFESSVNSRAALYSPVTLL